MSRVFLNASLRLWLRRLTSRKERLAHWRAVAHKKEKGSKKAVVTRDEAAEIHKWEKLVAEAEKNVARRHHQIADLKPQQSVREKAVAHARAFAGKTSERPWGSNGGGIIDTWERRLGFGHVSWCGIFCANMLLYVGVKNVTSRLAAVALIEEDAKAKRYCFRGWTRDPNAVHGGDLVVLFGYGVHVEMVDYIKNGIVYTIGGNTSSGDGGSQANGGGVYRRARPMSVVRGFALVNYPG